VIGLERAARDFIENEDFSIQAEKTSDDELGSMIDAFNMMVKKMEERENIIIQGREVAESANRMKSLFLANMSHELRTPLNSIMGMTQLITREDEISSDVQEMSNVIYKSSQNLLDIVNDILDISKIESGVFSLESKDTDFTKLIGHMLESLSPVASKNGISLTSSLPGKSLPIIKADSLRLNQILTNLVGNAIKYIQDPHDSLDKNRDSTAQQKQGFININVDFTQIDDESIELIVEVKDNGIGIASDKAKTIFEKFRQADDTITRRFGGTGLGLAITQDLVQMMGGEIGVRSTLGLGSLFWFKIPFTISTSSHIEEIEHNNSSAITPQKMYGPRLNASTIRLLVAEDVELNQQYISRLLQHIGLHDFKIVGNGELALEAFQQEDYDLILMDCHMPKTNGYDATVQIRTLEQTSESKRINIIDMTAYAMKGAEEKCLEVGMDAYIAKPLDISYLKKVLSTWIDFDEQSSLAAQAINATEHTEESPINLALIKQFMNNKTQIKHFINLFKTQSDDYLLKLSANCKGGESILWVETIHSFKGCVLIIGAEKLVELLQMAEDLLVSDKTTRQEHLTQITTEYTRVLEHLEKLE
jgi:signal transduction histidine kinase/CheY-like chemotaxis protein